MIASYETLPREELHVQTHATLSGIRGVLRYARITGEQKYLDLGRAVFELYKTKAWTDHYANYNWFGLPRWTEPCAVIDSFLISQELWEATVEERYLKDAHHILYNAVAHAERVNGAFGTDLCVGAKVKPPKETGGTDSEECNQAILFAKALTYEVFWCCNMRGGDGLSRAAQYSFYTEGSTVTIPYFHTCTIELELESGRLNLHEKANYPASGSVSFEVLENTAGAVTLKFFAPETWTSGAASRVLLNGIPVPFSFENGFVVVSVELKAGDRLVLDVDMKVYTFDSHECIYNSREHFSFRHGPMMLGVKSVLEDAEDEPSEITILRDAEIKPLGGDRYEAVTTRGDAVVLQPMWGKENLINPLDVYQILFARDP